MKQAALGGMSYANEVPQLCCHRKRRKLLFFGEGMGAYSFIFFQLNSFYRLIPDEKKTVFLDNKHFCYQSKKCRNEDFCLKVKLVQSVPDQP